MGYYIIYMNMGYDIRNGVLCSAMYSTAVISTGPGPQSTAHGPKRTKEHVSFKWPLQAPKGIVGGMGGMIRHTPPLSGHP